MWRFCSEAASPSEGVPHVLFLGSAHSLHPLLAPQAPLARCRLQQHQESQAFWQDCVPAPVYVALMSSPLTVVTDVESSRDQTRPAMFSPEPLSCLREAGKIWEEVGESTSGAPQGTASEAVERHPSRCVNPALTRQGRRREQASGLWRRQTPWAFHRVSGELPGVCSSEGSQIRRSLGRTVLPQGNPFLGRVLTPSLPNLQNIVNISKRGWVRGILAAGVISF